jgi:two-component system, NarL family, response regulator YdfI
MSEQKKPIGVLIADDHPVVRQGLRMMLEMAHGFELVGEATDGGMAVRLTAERQPDVVLMDLRMPGMDGLEAIARIRGKWPQVAILILTTYNEDDLMIRGLQAGACGYLLKDTDLEIVLQAIRVAARGEMLAQPEIMQRILSHAAQAISSPSLSNAMRGGLELTEREREVLAGVARGERSKEIAVRLALSERTVESYLSNIYSKLGVDSRASAVAVAMERGLLPHNGEKNPLPG